VHAVGLPVRDRRYAGADPDHHLVRSSTLFRLFPADGVSGWRHLGGFPAESISHGRNWGVLLPAGQARHAQEPRASPMSDASSTLAFTRLRAQFIKEVLSILRDPRSRMVVFVPPLLQLLVFAFAATLEVRNVDIAVHNQDAGRWSQELVTRLERAEFVNQI